MACLALACGDDSGDESSTGPTGTSTQTDGSGSAGTTAGSGSADATGTSGSGSTGSSTATGSTDDGPPVTTGPVGDGGSFDWLVNRQGDHDYGHQLTIPPTFGQGEFSLQLWIKPNPDFPVGPTDGSSLENWAEEDIEPYDSGAWWYAGNFLLDGHNNITGFDQGTFSLQFYGGGRVRWLFGDTTVIPGGVLSMGAYPADTTESLLDDAWHQLTMVRRFVGATDAQLELWIDGALVGTETSALRTDMRQFWDTWPGFGGAQDGWFWGAEKQAAVGKLSMYEDYKGLMAELRFWDVALQDIETTYADAVAGDEPGLVGWYPWNEGSGAVACDVLSADCIDLYRTDDAHWVEEGPPLQ